MTQPSGDEQLSVPGANFLKLIAGADRILLTGHEHPDGDCLGAEVAFYHLLRALGKDPRIYNPDPALMSYDFLEHETPFSDMASGDRMPDYDLLCLLDCAQLSRLGRLAPKVRGRNVKIAVIDHHVGSENGDGTACFVDATAPATGALIYRLYKHYGVPLSLAAAEGVFLSLVSDTGWFRYSNTTSEVFRIAADLVDAGVDASRIYDLIYRRNDPECLDMLANALRGSGLRLDGRLGYLFFDKLAIDRATRIGFDTDLAMDPLRSLVGVEVVVMIKERFDGGVKLSLRSQGSIDVQKIAQFFGGGGHKKAAGASLETSLEDALRRVEVCVKEALDAKSRGETE